MLAGGVTNVRGEWEGSAGVGWMKGNQRRPMETGVAGPSDLLTHG